MTTITSQWSLKVLVVAGKADENSEKRYLKAEREI